MSLNNYRDEAGDFLHKIGAEDEKIEIKLKMLDNEFNTLKESINNPDTVKHQIYDILFLLFEVAYDYKLDLEEEWNKGKERKQKKYINSSKV